MASSAETCWKVSRDCGQWASESRDNTVRLAFHQMAKGWARVAFSEEFTSTADEHIDHRGLEDAKLTPVGRLALSLLPPPAKKRDPDSTQPETGRGELVGLSLQLRTVFPRQWASRFRAVQSVVDAVQGHALRGVRFQRRCLRSLRSLHIKVDMLLGPGRTAHRTLAGRWHTMSLRFRTMIDTSSWPRLIVPTPLVAAISRLEPLVKRTRERSSAQSGQTSTGLGSSNAGSISSTRD
jgi:hypothetical protein